MAFIVESSVDLSCRPIVYCIQQEWECQVYSLSAEACPLTFLFVLPYLPHSVSE